jgi:hypothetical protein
MTTSPVRFRLLDHVEEHVLAVLAGRLEQLEVEGPSEHGRGGEHSPAVGAQAVEPAADDEADPLGHIELADGERGPEAAGLVEQAAFLDEELEHLLDEEGVALRLAVDDLHQRRRGALTAHGLQHLGRFRHWHAPERDPPAVAPAEEILEGPGQGAADVRLAVAVRPHHEDRGLGQALSQVLNQQQRRLVGPLQVVENEQDGTVGRRPQQDVPDPVEEHPPLLFGGQLERRRDVRTQSTETGNELGDLGGVLAERLAERLGARGPGQRLLEDLHEGDVGRGSLHLVGVAHEDLHLPSRTGRFGDQLLGQARLAHAGLPADEHQSTRPPPGLVQQPLELRPLRGPADEGSGPPGRGHRPLVALVGRPHQAEEPPALGESLQPAPAPVPEGQVRALAGELLDDLGAEDLAALGPGRDPGGGVDRLAVEITVLLGHLSGVETDADVDLLTGRGPVALGLLPLDGDRARQRAPRRGEGHHEPVAEGFHLPAPVLGHAAPDQFLMGSQQSMGGVVAPLRPQLRGALDVGEEDRDRPIERLAHAPSPGAILITVRSRVKLPGEG